MRIENQNIREFLAEGLGTFILVAIGCAANASSKVAGLSFPAVALSWGMALTAGIYVAGGISGGHLNPGVSLGMAAIGKLPIYKLPHYLASQFIGAFFGALVVFLNYSHAITNKHNGFIVTGKDATADIFGTYPSSDSTNALAFFEQLVACSFFLILINAITDKRNMNCPKGLVPIAIGVTDLTLCVLTYSYNSGGAINAARDFSPRLLSAMLGYGGETFTTRGGYFWIPLVACPFGSIVGSLIYKYVIEDHWPKDDLDTSDPSNKPVIFSYKTNRIPSLEIKKY